MICMMILTYADNVGPLMFVATFFSGNFTCVCIGEIEVIQFLLRFYEYSSLVVELQENFNLQVANNTTYSTWTSDCLNMRVPQYQCYCYREYSMLPISNSQYCVNLFVDLISLIIPLWKRYFPLALYTLPEYVLTRGGYFMFMACSTLYEMTISVVCSLVSLL